MNKVKQIIKEQFGFDCFEITEIHGGLSAMNYKFTAENIPLFLKIYDKKKAQSSLWTENINFYMPVLVWLNENTTLRDRIVNPLKTKDGNFLFEDKENVYLLFNFIDGITVGKQMSPLQIKEAAEIMACLHSVKNNFTDKIKEDFTIPFCELLKNFFEMDFEKAPDDIKMLLQPYLNQILKTNNEVKLLSEKVKHKKINFVLCHTDAHGYNIMQTEHLFLVDWEGLKSAPAEADLFMFSKKEYWSIFIEHYLKMRPDFTLDDEIFTFYILRRKIEDIWAFIESILYNNLTAKQRECDLAHLLNCCNSLNNMCFEL